MAALFEFDFHEANSKSLALMTLCATPAGRAIGRTRHQRSLSHARGFLQSQHAARQGHDDVVMGVL